QDLEDAVMKELDRLKTEPVEEKELKKILKMADAQFINDLSSNSGMARKLAFFEAVAGDWKYILQWRQVVDSITAGDVMRVARQYFTRENSTIAYLVKKGDEKGGNK
ncbi:MAG: insulinase family protein, partial [Spirochaetota bacterium]